MTILPPATQQQQTIWQPVPEGLWRWQIGQPELKFRPQYEKWAVRFPLTLTDEERKRLEAEYPAPRAGAQQSWRTSYTVGLSLGFFRDGQYVSTKLIDFLAAGVGRANAKRFRGWIEQGGGPAIPANASEQEELAAIRDWLAWWHELEVLGSVTHQPDAQQPGVIWSRFGGPLPVGSLPGQPDQAYQAFGLGKLRAMVAEQGGPADLAPLPSDPQAAPMPQVLAVAGAVPPAGTAATPAGGRTYEEIFGADEPADPSDENTPL